MLPISKVVSAYPVQFGPANLQSGLVALIVFSSIYVTLSYAAVTHLAVANLLPFRALTEQASQSIKVTASLLLTLLLTGLI